MFFVSVFIITLCSGFSAQPDNELVEKIKNDKVMKALIAVQIKDEEDMVISNRAWLKHLEEELKMFVKNGIVEEEDCIRQNISALRAIDHSYNWVLDQLKDIDTNEIRLGLIEKLDRVEYLNKMFADRALRIEECNLKYAKNDAGSGNEIIKYSVGHKKEPVRRELLIPEEYKAARSPFR